MKNLLADFPVITELAVSWGDMDALQHVNHIVYFRYFLNGRVDYLEKLNALNLMEETAVGFILASIQCQFKIPLTYPDKLLLGTKVGEILDDRISIIQNLVSSKHEKIAAEAEVILVTFDYRKNRKTDLPKELQQRIKDLENSKQEG